MKMIILFTLLLTSCSSYIAKLHKSFDQADNKRYIPKSSAKKFDFYRNGGKSHLSNRHASMKRSLSTKNMKNLNPKIRRAYSPLNVAKRRFKADDLLDNKPDGSLWAGESPINHLFTKEKKKENGDIVVIEVYKKLKKEISTELKRAFPKPKSKDAQKDTEGKAEATKTAQGDSEESSKAIDKISSVIIEEINADHLLVRGRKQLLFRNRKHFVEIQALVSRRDISNLDTIHSDNILESSVVVLR